MLNAKSSLKQTKDTHFGWSFNLTNCSRIKNKLSVLEITKILYYHTSFDVKHHKKEIQSVDGSLHSHL